MKGLFFRLLQQRTVLLLALVLGIGVAYFLLRYVPQRTESLNKRYFLVLAHVGKGLVAAAPITGRNSAIPAKPIQLQVPSNVQGTTSPADTSLTGKLSKKTAATSADSFAWQPTRQLLDSLRRRDVFKHFFVVDLATRRLLYSSSPTGFYLDEAPLARKWPRWLADSSAAHGSRTAELLLNGETYRLFAQPVRFRSGEGILLCGTVPNEQFNKDRWSLPAGWPTTILGLVLLGVLALPFLKLWLMSTREQLERIDVAYCGAALVLGSGILLLTIQALLVRYGSGQDQIDQQLTGLSRVVTPSLKLLLPAAQPPLPATGNLAPDSVRRAPAVEAQSVLAEQPLPPGFDFCLVDHQGKVLYHANPALRQSENLLDDCLPGTKVRAALFEQTTFVGDVTYQGKPTRLYMSPLTPLIRPDSTNYVVTFFDLRYARTHQLQAWMLALELLAGFWLFGLLFWLAHRLVVRHTDRWPLNRDSFKHFWPCNGYALRYWRVVIGQLGALALLVMAAEFTQPLTQLYLLLVVPVQLYLLTFRYTRLKSSLPDRPQDFNPLFRTFMLVGLFLAAVTKKYCYLLHPNQSAFDWPAKLLLGFEGIQIILAGGIYYITQRGKILADSRWLAIGKKVLAGFLILGGTAVFFRHGPTELVKVLAARIALSALLWGMWYRVFGLGEMTSARNWMAKHDRWGYGAVVLGWVMLLGLAPAFVCYRGAYLAEQLYEVRHSQLAMAQVSHDENSQPNNIKFFFGTTDGSQPETKTSSQVAANLSVLAGLHTTVDTLLAKSALALQPDTVARQPLWYVSALTNDDSLTVRTTVAGRTYQSRVSTDLPTWYFWLGIGLMIAVGIGLYHLIPRIFTVVAGPPTKLIQLDREEAALLPKVTVPVHHYWLLPGGSDWRDAARWFVKLLPIPHPQAEDIFDCRLLFAEQHLGKAPKASPKKTDKITDKARFKNLLQTASESSTSTLDGASPIVLTHFDYRSGDALVTQHKRQSIEALLLTGRPLLVLSSIHPMGFSDGGPTATPENQQRVHESGFELLDALSNFRLQYFSLRWLNQPRMLPGLENTPVDAAIKPEEVKAAVARAQALLFKDDQLLQKFFDKECEAFPFVEALRDDVLGSLWRQRALEHKEASRLLTLNNDAQRATDKLVREKSDDTLKSASESKASAREAEADTRKENWWTKPTHEAIADTIRRLAWLHFQRLWRALSAQERFLLYDLAYDGLVNSNNRHHLHNLLHKGLLRLDEYGRLHVASEGFRAFIFAAQRRPDALRYAQDATDDTWGIVKPPLVLLLVAGALLIAVTYPSQQIQQMLALLATVVSLISLLFRTPTRATPPATKGE